MPPNLTERILSIHTKDIIKSIHSGKYRPDIDGLRALAVFSVVIYHAFPKFLPGGFIGVDIFFVISGYLITGILISNLNAGKFSILHFYDRRVRRIFPALVTVLLATLGFAWYVLFRPEFWILGKHVAASTLFAENILLWSEDGYFDRASNHKPLLHLWSLAIEEQFYIFWPVMMLVLWRYKISFLFIIIVLGATSFAVNISDIADDPAAAYYSPFGRFWELMIGGALAYIQLYKPSILAEQKELQSAFGMGLIVIGLVVIDPDRNFPGFWAIMPTLGAFLLISGGQHANVNRKLLSSPMMVWGGLISYPLYLWHWPIFSYAYIVLKTPTSLQKIVLMLLAVMLGILTFFFIERPFRGRGGGSRIPQALIAAMTAVLGIGATIYLTDANPRLYNYDAPSKTEWDYLRSQANDFDSNGNGVYEFNTNRDKLALFIGDSQIAQYAERIASQVETDPKRFGAIIAIGGGCIPISNVFSDDIRRKDCWELRDLAFKRASEERIKRVLIGGSWNLYFLEGDYEFRKSGNKMSLKTHDGKAAAMKRLEKQIKELIASGKEVFLLIANPINADFDPSASKIRLLQNHRFENQAIKIDQGQLDLRKDFLTLAQRTGAVVIDPLPEVCNADRCNTTTADGMPIYVDDSHFNPEWAIDHTGFIDGVTAP